MKDLLKKIDDIDSKLAEVNDIIQEVYNDIEAECDLEERDEIISNAIAQVTGNEDDEFLQAYLEILRGLETLFE